MEEIRARMTAIEDPRHQSYVKYPLADILIIIRFTENIRKDLLGISVQDGREVAKFIVIVINEQIQDLTKTARQR